MKIELEEPYKSKWRFGYIVINPEGRRNVILFNSRKDRSTTSFARYTMSVSLGRMLEGHEHVDHIDNDKTNDDLVNLQLLSISENNLKAAKAYGREKSITKCVCPICGISFGLSTKDLKFRPEPKCSRKCGRISASIKLKNR